MSNWNKRKKEGSMEVNYIDFQSDWRCSYFVLPNMLFRCWKQNKIQPKIAPNQSNHIRVLIVTVLNVPDVFNVSTILNAIIKFHLVIESPNLKKLHLFNISQKWWLMKAIKWKLKEDATISYVISFFCLTTHTTCQIPKH